MEELCIYYSRARYLQSARNKYVLVTVSGIVDVHLVPRLQVHHNLSRCASLWLTQGCSFCAATLRDTGAQRDSHIEAPPTSLSALSSTVVITSFLSTFENSTRQHMHGSWFAVFHSCLCKLKTYKSSHFLALLIVPARPHTL